MSSASSSSLRVSLKRRSDGGYETASPVDAKRPGSSAMSSSRSSRFLQAEARHCAHALHLLFSGKKVLEMKERAVQRCNEEWTQKLAALEAKYAAEKSELAEAAKRHCAKLKSDHRLEVTVISGNLMMAHSELTRLHTMAAAEERRAEQELGAKIAEVRGEMVERNRLAIAEKDGEIAAMRQQLEAANERNKNLTEENKWLVGEMATLSGNFQLARNDSKACRNHIAALERRISELQSPRSESPNSSASVSP